MPRLDVIRYTGCDVSMDDRARQDCWLRRGDRKHDDAHVAAILKSSSLAAVLSAKVAPGVFGCVDAGVDTLAEGYTLFAAAITASELLASCAIIAGLLESGTVREGTWLR